MRLLAGAGQGGGYTQKNVPDKDEERLEEVFIVFYCCLRVFK